MNKNPLHHESLQLDIRQYHDSALYTHSKLKAYWEMGPAAFREVFIDKAHKLQRTHSPALVFGQAFDDAVCDFNAFQSNYVKKPDGKEGDGRTKEGKAFREANKSKTILDPSDYDRIERMIWSMYDALHLPKDAEPQPTWCHTLVSNNDVEIRLASRPDFWIPSRKLVVDVKTSSKWDKWFHPRWSPATDYGYWRQAGSQLKLCPDADAKHCWLVVESEYPFRAMTVNAAPSVYEAGWQWSVSTATAIYNHIAFDNWPRETRESPTIEYTEDMHNQVIRANDAAGF